MDSPNELGCVLSFDCGLKIVLRGCLFVAESACDGIIGSLAKRWLDPWRLTGSGPAETPGGLDESYARAFAPVKRAVCGRAVLARAGARMRRLLPVLTLLPISLAMPLSQIHRHTADIHRR